MAVIYDNIRIDESEVRRVINGKRVYDACSVAFWLGFKRVDSGHGAYRPVLRILNKLHENDEIGKGRFANNVSIFYSK